MDFETLLQQLINPGEDGPGDSIYDDLGASYTDATSTRDAKIADSSAVIAQLTEELTRTKLMNYELMLGQVAEPAPEGDNGESNNESESDDIGDDEDFFDSEDN